ncbi:SRPBCC family protein [Occultella gossypii]|uniref:SRPBCC domain-containing protein n=1 Tax=Occultella gossypii TaxID=2800820 RepID=A0ABS7SCL4_9MICO|nr:SRPBCC family protein [Occultella gossypii]MBZ2198108.1 SRPBCC domain-containing protein [Occultella gossypii]
MDDTIRRALTGTAERPTLTFRRTYRATPAQVHDACTNPERLARWFGDVAGSPSRTGDAFTAVLSDETGDVAAGRVLSCSAQEIAVSWSWQGEAESVISARISALDASTTELTLQHSLAEPAHAVGYGGGWEQCLHALARSLGAPPDGAADVVEADAAAHWRTITRTPLELEQRVEAPPDRVWAAFTTADGLRSWWWRHWDDVRFDVDARVGGGYRIEAPGAGITLRGAYLALDEPGHLAFTWVWEDGDGSVPDEAVDVRIVPDGGGCVVQVRHSGPWVDDGPAASYRQGWEFTLGQLALVLGG